MEILESIVSQIHRLDWQLDDIANVLIAKCRIVCEYADISMRGRTALDNEDYFNSVAELQSIANRISRTAESDDSSSNIINACLSYRYYSSRVIKRTGDYPLQMICGTAFSSLNLLLSYLMYLNPIGAEQNVAFFIQACPLDQPLFNCILECESLIDLCESKNIYPVIYYSINPNAFQNLLYAFSKHSCLILHFATHGSRGRIVFCTPGSYKSVFIDHSFLLTSLGKAWGTKMLPLIYVNACFSDLLSGQLIIRKANCPIVRRTIGVSGKNNNILANEFSSSFYCNLSKHDFNTDVPLAISNSFFETKQAFGNRKYANRVVLAKRRRNK